MLVYRWETSNGEGCFWAGINSYMHELSYKLGAEWKDNVHDALPLPKEEMWFTADKQPVEVIEYFYMDNFPGSTLRFAFETLEQCRFYIEEKWDKYLVQFGCSLVTYEVSKHTVLFADSQVVFLEEFSKYVEEIIS